jgi:RHS repeat-associated protein
VVNTNDNRFVYDGDHIITHDKVVNGVTTFAKRYVWGAGADELLARYDSADTSTRRYAHADERGSIIAVTAQDGSVIETNRYDEYGIPGSGNSGQFQYTGQMWLSSLGLAHYKARTYSPTLGRFLLTDPIGYGDGMNWYNYVGGDPVNGTDPSGLARDKIVVNGLRNKGLAAIQSTNLQRVSETMGGRGGGNGEVGRYRTRPTEQQQACAYSVGAAVAGAALGATATATGLAALIPSPATPALAGAAALEAGLGAVLGFYGHIGEKAFCK